MWPRPPSLVPLITHSHEHLFHVRNANRLLPRRLIFPEHVHLPAGELVTLDGVRLGEVGAHVVDEGAGRPREVVRLVCGGMVPTPDIQKEGLYTDLVGARGTTATINMAWWRRPSNPTFCAQREPNQPQRATKDRRRMIQP
jgi:hypothetical protein